MPTSPLASLKRYRIRVVFYTARIVLFSGNLRGVEIGAKVLLQALGSPSVARSQYIARTSIPSQKLGPGAAGTDLEELSFQVTAAFRFDLRWSGNYHTNDISLKTKADKQLRGKYFSRFF